MSLETLLEAAKFVEHSKKPDDQARAPDGPAFHHYAKAAPPSQRETTDSEKSDDDEESKAALKERRRLGGAGTREVHNKLEKNRRAHLKECFDNLKYQIPSLDGHDRKVSNLSILRGALRYIQMLKRREKELDVEMQKHAQNKTLSQEKISSLKADLKALNIDVDIANFMLNFGDEDTRSVSTATADNESPIMSDDEDEGPSPAKILRPATSYCNVVMGSGGLLAVSDGPIFTKAALKAMPANMSPAILQQHNQQPPQSMQRPRQLVGASPVVAAAPVATLATGGHSAGHKTIAAMLTQSASGRRSTGQLMTRSPSGVLTPVAAGAGAATVRPAMTLSSASIPLAVYKSGHSLLNRADGFTLSPMTSPSAAVTSHTLINAKDTRVQTPVVKLLQQTITQRAQKQQQQQLRLQQATRTSTGVHDFATTSSPALLQPIAANLQQAVLALNANNLRAVAAFSGMKPITQIRPAVINHVLPSFMASPRLETSAAASGGDQKPATVTVAVSNAGVGASTTQTTSVLGGLTFVTPSTHMSGLGLSGMKPILTVPLPAGAAQLISPAQVSTITQLMSQIPNTRSNTQAHVIATATPTGAQLLSSSQVSMAGLTSIPVTQFIPLTMVSPGTQTGTQLGGVTTAQFNAAAALSGGQVLKTLGALPLLQQSFSLPIKPIVVVSMPGMMTTTTTTTSSSAHASTSATVASLSVSNAS